MPFLSGLLALLGALLGIRVRLYVIGKFLRHRGLKRVDSDLYLLKIGLSGGYPLHKESRRGEYSRNDVIVLSRKHNELKPESDNKRKKCELC